MIFQKIHWSFSVKYLEVSCLSWWCWVSFVLYGISSLIIEEPSTHKLATIHGSRCFLKVKKYKKKKKKTNKKNPKQLKLKMHWEIKYFKCQIFRSFILPNSSTLAWTDLSSHRMNWHFSKIRHFFQHCNSLITNTHTRVYVYEVNGSKSVHIFV